MAKEWQKDASRTKTKTSPVKETVASAPEKTFSIDEFANKDVTSKVGRPRLNKKYGTIRLQKSNVNRINALQNTLDYETQDDIISSLIDRLENSLESEQRIMFDMYMKTYTARDKKKK